MNPANSFVVRWVLLEGGIISYDSNIITGGFGARYFGAGGSVKIQTRSVTVYLRMVSTSNGKILNRCMFLKRYYPKLLIKVFLGMLILKDS
jgi:curli production assembly/transport component CsgG